MFLCQFLTDLSLSKKGVNGWVAETGAHLFSPADKLNGGWLCYFDKVAVLEKVRTSTRLNLQCCVVSIRFWQWGWLCRGMQKDDHDPDDDDPDDDDDDDDDPDDDDAADDEPNDYQGSAGIKYSYTVELPDSLNGKHRSTN